MNLKSLLAALRRRWYLVTVGILLTAGMVTAAAMMVPPSYTTTSSILLLPPRSTLGQRGNPYLNLGGLGPAVDVLAKRLSASDPAQAMMEANPDVTITAEPDISSTGPILLLTVEAPTQAAAIQFRDAVTALVEPTLADMQNEMSVGSAAQITTSIIAADARPEVSHRGQLRIIIVAAGGGLLLTMLGTALIDGALMRRRRRRDARGESEAPDDSVAAEEDADSPAEVVAVPEPEANPPSESVESTETPGDQAQSHPEVVADEDEMPSSEDEPEAASSARRG